MMAGPIPFTAVLTWAEFEDLDAEATRLLWQVVCYLEGQRADRLEAERTLAELGRRRRNRK